MTESIANHVLGGLGGFKRLSERMRESDDTSLQASLLHKLDDELARFKVWAGSSGAHRIGRASLEYRLREASHVRQQVLSLLSDLKESLNDAMDIIIGKTTPWEKIEDEEESLDNLEIATEIEQIVLDITESVDCLLRLSVSIQNPAPHDRFMSSAYTDTSTYEEFDVKHVRDKFQDLEDCLAQRLGKAMSRRRQYFKYREAHHEKLSHGLDLPEDTNNMEPTLHAPSTLASSIPLQMKLGIPNIYPDDDTQSTGRVSVTSFATSDSGSKTLKVPHMPEDALKGPFMCPFCFLLISVENTRDWREHVFGDLRPYNCLAPDCESSDREFSRRNEWMQHMIQSHLRVYRCSFGCPDSFSSATESKSHLLEAHSGAIPESRIDSIVQFNSHPLAQDAHTTCPFCSEPLKSLKHYRRHVGNHQQDLALFALPNIECEDVLETEESGHESDKTNFIEEENEHKDDREPDRKKTKPDSESERLRFACPFYQRDPQRYKTHRACRGPGWTEMHRLKEHLYRQHRLFTCGRCLEHFKKDELLQEHVRAEKACALSSRKMDPAEGMSMETEKQIKSHSRHGKKDKQDKLDDVGRWYEIYHILFGDVSTGDLPSPYVPGPYYGTDPRQTQYRHFLRREVPNMVKRELEAEVAKSFKDTEPTTQSRLTAMIQSSVEKCAKLFEYIPTPSDAAPHGDPDDSPVVWPNGVSEFDFPVDFNLDALSNDFDPSGDNQTYNECFPAFDSAYESGSIGESSRNYRM